MIWLIGSTGLLGSAVLEELKRQNISFVATDSKIDITAFDILYNFINKQTDKITHIINCAGYTNVDKAESETSMAEKLNITGPENIAKITKKINATLIHISTDYVFDGKSRSPISENENTSPLSVYGKTKDAGDKKVKIILSKYYILRTSWLYGFKRKNFVTTMINLMNSKDSVKVVNDQTGSPTFAGDLADVIVKIILKELKNEKIPYGIYNYSNIGDISWFDFAQEIKLQGEQLGIIHNKNCKLSSCTTSDYNAAALRPAYSVLDKEKITTTLNIKIPNWKESLLTFLSALKLKEN